MRRQRVGRGGLGGRRLKSMARSINRSGRLSLDRGLAGRGRGRLAAYVSLTKPRLVVLVLVTVARRVPAGCRAAARIRVDAGADAAGDRAGGRGAQALNQWLERARDARMRRTANRACPAAGWAVEAALFGRLGLAGTRSCSGGATCWPAELVLLRRVDSRALRLRVHTAEAMDDAEHGDRRHPRRIAAGDRLGGRDRPLGVEAWSLFLIVFLWQFPHFLAIAWIYRDDYARAGFRMLPEGDPRGRLTGRQAVSYALALVPAGLLPATVGLAGPFYFAGALVLGLLYLIAAARFWLEATDRRARRLLRASFLYLPAILLLLLLNPCRIDEPLSCRFTLLSGLAPRDRNHDGRCHPSTARPRPSRPARRGHAHGATTPRSLPARSPCGSSWPRR